LLGEFYVLTVIDGAVNDAYRIAGERFLQYVLQVLRAFDPVTLAAE
jgi:hypothetical protein